MLAHNTLILHLRVCVTEHSNVIILLLKLTHVFLYERLKIKGVDIYRRAAYMSQKTQKYQRFYNLRNGS